MEQQTFAVDEATYNKISIRFKAVLCALQESQAKAACVQSYQARYYAYGWQDRSGDSDEHDTVQGMAFGDAYGTVWGLYALDRIPARPNIAEAWKSWSVHGHIIDDYLGTPTKLDLLDP